MEIQNHQITRESYIDAVAGLLIVHMIYGHVIQWAHLTETDALYLFFQKVLGFFMLWFCFKAGMYFKSKKTETILISSFHRLLVPFIIFSIIGYITWSAKMILEGENNWKQYLFTPIKQILEGGAIGGNLPLWYLSTLFVARIVFNWIVKKIEHYPFLLLFALIPFVIKQTECELPLYVSNISLAVTFMGLGFFLKPYIKNVWVSFISIAVFILLVVLYPTYVDMRHNSLLFCNYYLWYLIALSGIITINTCFRVIPYNMPVLSFIGTHSMAFFCIHWIVFTVCRIFFILLRVNYYSYAFVIVGLLFCFISIPLLNNYFKKHNMMWILGEANSSNLSQTHK